MKIVVINNSGNVGKTTITQNMILPRFPESEVVRVETLNDDGESTGEKLGADDFDDIFNTILSSESVIVDVGASNVELFSTKLKTDFAGSHSFIDLFIVPVTPEEKQQRDTIATLVFLSDIGVDADKIKVIYNKVNPKKTIQQQFSTLFENSFLQELGVLNGKALGVNNSSLFDTLKKAKIPYDKIKDINSDELEKAISESEDKQEKIRLNLYKFYKMGFDSYQSNLQDVFASLNIN